MSYLDVVIPIMAKTKRMNTVIPMRKNKNIAHFGSLGCGKRFIVLFYFWEQFT